MELVSEKTPLLFPTSCQNQIKLGNEASEDTVASSADVTETCERRPPFTPAQKRLLAALSLVSLLTGSLAALMFPFFPAEAASRGISQTLISGVFSCFAATQLASYPALGRIAPAIGVTRLFSLGLVTAAVTTVVFGSLEHITDPQVFIGACFAVRMVEALGAAAVSTCSYTIIGSRIQERAATAVGVVTAFQSVGLAISPAVGGGLYAWAGFGVPFYILGGIMLVTGIILAMTMPQILDADRADTWDYIRRLFRLFSRAEAWLCVLIIMIYAADFSTFSSCLAPYAEQTLGITAAELGLFYLVASTAYALLSVPWGWLQEGSRNPYYLVSACLLAASVSLVLMPPASFLHLAPSRWLIAGGMLLHEAVFPGAFAPCLPRLLLAGRAAGLPEGLATRSLVASVFGVAFALGFAVGPVSGGAVVDGIGFPSMMTSLAGVTSLVALLSLVQAVFLSCGADQKPVHVAV